MNCHFRWTNSIRNEWFGKHFFKKKNTHTQIKRVHAAHIHTKLHNAMLSLDNHSSSLTGMPWEKCCNQPDLALVHRCLGLLSLPFHNEVMKQQVWTARSAWVDKPTEKRRDYSGHETPGINCWSQKQPSYTVLTFRDSCLQPLSALLVKVANNSPPTKTSKRGNPRAQPSYY